MGILTGQSGFSFMTDGISTKEEYKQELQKTFGTYLLSDNIDAAAFVRGNPGFGLQLGVNTDGRDGGGAMSAKAIKSVTTPIFTVHIPFKPKTISVAGYIEQAVSTLIGWGLVFTGNVSNIKRSVIFYADASRAIDTDGYCYIDDTNAVELIAQSGLARTSIDVSIDVENDLALCFKDSEDTAYTMEYIDMQYTKHTETIPNVPFYLQKLEIFK